MSPDSPQQDWITSLSSLREAGQACAMVTVTDVRGSAPREPGARMIVADGRLVWGTIGGGNLEKLAIEQAQAFIDEHGCHTASVNFPLAESAGQCCGGEVTVFFETFVWRRPKVVVFGAGHVGQAIGGLVDYLQADVLLIDEREESQLQPPPAPARPYELLCIDEPQEEVDALPADALLLIMTHSHARDLEIVVRALERGPFAYIGMIGSERKWARFRKRLLQRGFTEDQLSQVTCPIGEGRTSKEPSAIAISVAAQLLTVLA
ncbi:xanthine dehydrogenase accessory protein XdhC [Candidatus Woesearchaeota archaeon]|nr:xanthine dehydrogenase accessory protein XdhC [Candidatus Woesearchaeota archaeon]MDP6740363.1 xanthine dehydrogenase accessory protein XdhC [Planctomycetota bacterium]MDP6939920.1 xanthine dehydrogenase accessory protein XdhC [Planctomycetota bacterium]